MLVLPLKVEILAELFLDGSLHGLEDIGEDAEVRRVVLIILTTLKDTRSNKARVPAIVVTTDDVGRWVVADLASLLAVSA